MKRPESRATRRCAATSGHEESVRSRGSNAANVLIKRSCRSATKRFDAICRERRQAYHVARPLNSRSVSILSCRTKHAGSLLPTSTSSPGSRTRPPLSRHVETSESRLHWSAPDRVTAPTYGFSSPIRCPRLKRGDSGLFSLRPRWNAIRTSASTPMIAFFRARTRCRSVASAT